MKKQALLYMTGGGIHDIHVKQGNTISNKSTFWLGKSNSSYFREGNGTPLQYSCLENPMDGGAWKAAVHAVAEGRTRLSDFTSTFHFHASEREMATHSSVLAWRIPGTEEPGGLPYMGLQSRTWLKRLSSSSSSKEGLYPVNSNCLLLSPPASSHLDSTVSRWICLFFVVA